MDKKEIGINLKYNRKIRKISAYKIQEDIKIDNSIIYRYENGQVEPTILNLIKLADYYKISLDELVGRDFF